MGTTVEKRIYTYEDYLKSPDDKRYELMEGDLLMTPSPNTKHQRILGRLFALLFMYVTERGAGEVFVAPYDVRLDDNVFEPDILFIAKNRLNIIGEKHVQGAPDLIAEIVSPSSIFHDTVKKKELYQRYGVKEYWLVFPEEKAIEVLTIESGVYRELCSAQGSGNVRSGVLDGLTIDLKAVFV